MRTKKEEVEAVLSYASGTQLPHAGDLVDTWMSAKDVIRTHFLGGKNVICSDDIYTYHMTEEDKENAFNTFNETIVANSNFRLYLFLKHVGYKNFFANITVDEYSHNDIVVPKGIKVIKAFKFFCKQEYDLRILQDKASEVLQKDKISGRLYISIEPLDFLSSSENCESWRSCHALDGEYKAGNLSYMTDKATMVAYLCDDTKKKLPDFPDDIPWNSKKWRCLIFTSNDHHMIFAGRQYPFSSQEILSRVIDLLNKHSSFVYTKWYDSMITEVKDGNTAFYLNKRYVPIGGELVPIDKAVRDNSKLHYNDLLYSTYYKKLNFAYSSTWYSQNTPGLLTTVKDTFFEIGNHPKCCKCGDEKIYDSNDFMCGTCEVLYGSRDDDDFAFCNRCGDHFMTQGMIWNEWDEAWYCPTCYDIKYSEEEEE